MPNDMIKKAGVYKMVILMVILFSFNSLSSAILASFLNVDWATLSVTSRWLIVIVIIQNWTGTLMAFFNKTISRVEQGKFPIDTGDSDPRAFVRTTTETTVKQP